MMKKSIALAALAGAFSAAHAQPAVQPVVVRSVAHFEFDRDTLSPADAAQILAEVAKLADVTWQTIEATGHTDSVGSGEYNAGLSQRRAAAVRRYLVGKGLDTSMIRTAARSEDAPVASNDTADGRARNRRTEIEFRGVRRVER